MENNPDFGNELLIEVWKQTIQVQQHFNDIELRIRNYAITLLGAVFGVAAYAFKEHAPTGVIIGLLLGGLILCYAFYFMDRHWYHRLLIGSVKHGLFIEKNAPQILGVTKAIGDESPVRLWGKDFHSDHKIRLFYALIAAAIGAMALFILLFAPSNQSAAASVDSRQNAAGQKTDKVPYWDVVHL